MKHAETGIRRFTAAVRASLGSHKGRGTKPPLRKILYPLLLIRKTILGRVEGAIPAIIRSPRAASFLSPATLFRYSAGCFFVIYSDPLQGRNRESFRDCRDSRSLGRLEQ